jgi:hypothetical protein
MKPDQARRMAEESDLRSVMNVASQYADRFYDYRRQACQETEHDLRVFQKALEDQVREAIAAALVKLTQGQDCTVSGPLALLIGSVAALDREVDTSWTQDAKSNFRRIQKATEWLSQPPIPSQQEERVRELEDFSRWYWQACESSQPNDWMKAALAAQSILRSKKPDAARNKEQGK